MSDIKEDVKMKTWHLVVILSSIVVALCIIVVSSLNKEDTVKAEESVQEISMSVVEDNSRHETYDVLFEEVKYSDEPSEDIEVMPANYNGLYLEDDGTPLKNYANHSISAKSVITKDDISVISLSENEAWDYLTDGLITSYPNKPFREIKPLIQEMYANHATTIEVPIWFWENPKDDKDMARTTKVVKFRVHDKLKNIFINIFTDIYNDPSKPVININDRGMGTWVIRGKGHSDSRTISAHAMGGAIDINPSTGSYLVDGVRYGNSYGAKKMSQEMWKELPETHTKYHILYEDCPIVSIFKSYGFYWGGDWKSGTDCMHLAFIGDGASRQVGYKNYISYRR